MLMMAVSTVVYFAVKCQAGAPPRQPLSRQPPPAGASLESLDPYLNLAT
jgi:hypothetical protein